MSVGKVKRAEDKVKSVIFFGLALLTILGSCFAGDIVREDPPLGITVIENKLEKIKGLFVATGDNNYAISSKELLKVGWQSIAVNGNRIFIITLDGSAITTSLSSLTAQQLEILATIRANFVSNLVGIYLDYPESSSSVYVGGVYVPPSNKGSQSAAALIGSKISNTGGLNIASRIAASGAKTFSANAAITGIGIGSVRSNKLQVNNDVALNGNTNSLGTTVGQNNYNNLSPGVASYNAQPNTYNAQSYSTSTDLAYRCKNYIKRPFVANPVLNYYNTNNLLLKKSLNGDVYYFDLNGNIVDVYSDTVSISRKNYNTLLYRDYDFFSYYRPNLPLTINRIFLFYTQIFFVYNDGSVLVKTSSQLDATELSLVVPVRNQLKEVAVWVTEAVKVKYDVIEKTKLQKLALEKLALEGVAKEEILKETAIIKSVEKDNAIVVPVKRNSALDDQVSVELKDTVTTKVTTDLVNSNEATKSIQDFNFLPQSKAKLIALSPLDSGIPEIVGEAETNISIEPLRNRRNYGNYGQPMMINRYNGPHVAQVDVDYYTG